MVWKYKSGLIFFVWLMVLNLLKKKKLNTLSVNFYFCLFSRENCDLQNNKWFTVCRTLFVSKLVMTLFGVLAQSSRDCSLITESIVSNDEKYPFKILYYEPNKYLSFKCLPLNFHYFFQQCFTNVPWCLMRLCHKIISPGQGPWPATWRLGGDLSVTRRSIPLRASPETFMGHYI